VNLPLTRHPTLADRVSALKPSATVEMSERIRRGRAAGRRILGLSSGDPNLPTDPRIIAAAERAMSGGETHYSTPAGMPALREALACVRLCGGKPIALPMLDRIDPQAIEAAITPSTRAIILNSPVNPTGRILPKGELEAVVDIVQKHNLWLIFDQVYADLTYDHPIAFPQAIGAGRDRTLVVDSLSKSFGMTGWRLGYLAVPSGVGKQIVKFLQHSIYCVPPFIQVAGMEALKLYDELVPRYRALFRGRLERTVAKLSAVEGIDCNMSEATFYLFPRIAGDDVAIAKRWLDTQDVAVLPGSAFGAPGAGHLRLSLTTSEEDLDLALERIAKAGIGQQ
jgi:aspartate/methionine/tyrosine aminotransferase